MQIWRKFASYPRIMNLNSKKAVLCHWPEKEKFTFSYHLDIEKPFIIKKDFNMERFKDEKVTNFMHRLTENLNKIVEKKNKKKKKKVAEPEENAMEISISENVQFAIDEKIIHFKSEDSAIDFLTQHNLKMSIFDSHYEIEINPPLVENVKLPDVMMSGFLIYPAKLSFEFAQETESIFEWFVSAEKVPEEKFNMDSFVQKSKWILKNQGYFFTSENEDINRLVKLKITPKSGNRIGILHEIVGKNPISAGPGKCPFEDRQMFTQEFLPADELRVVTYNLLADLYADSDFSRDVLHPQCPHYALEIGYRKSLFIKGKIFFYFLILKMDLN